MSRTRVTCLWGQGRGAWGKGTASLDPGLARTGVICMSSLDRGTSFTLSVRVPLCRGNGYFQESAVELAPVGRNETVTVVLRAAPFADATLADLEERVEIELQGRPLNNQPYVVLASQEFLLVRGDFGVLEHRLLVLPSFY